jgi:hypothetical protein
MTTQKEFLLRNARAKSCVMPRYDQVVEDDDTREWYRFSQGLLTEYELTKYHGFPVKLTPEEKEAAEEFTCEVLEGIKV